MKLLSSCSITDADADADAHTDADADAAGCREATATHQLSWLWWPILQMSIT